MSSSRAHGGRRHTPFVFTEQGVAMLSSVLRSERAIDTQDTLLGDILEALRALEQFEAERRRQIGFRLKA